MKKRLNIIFNIVIPTIVGYATFFLLFYLFQKLFYEYRWLAVIPFVVVTAFIIKDNMREWKVIKQHS
jgi:glucan phosphoethanolaminetransferase (alkaline phosphatase superfamily)